MIHASQHYTKIMSKLITEEDRLLEQVPNILSLRPSGTARDFLEELLWFGWSRYDESKSLELEYMKSLSLMYGLS